MRVLGFLCYGLILLAPHTLHAQDVASLEGFFQGSTKAKGEFTAINGIKRQFDVDLNGTWDGRVLTLKEDFTFANGQKETKTWVFTKINHNQYLGTREDVIGETLVTIEGNVAKFNYYVFLDSANQKMKVRFHDTMVFEGGTVINNARITKFGFPVARTKVVFELAKIIS